MGYIHIREANNEVEKAKKCAKKFKYKNHSEFIRTLINEFYSRNFYKKNENL